MFKNLAFFYKKMQKNMTKHWNTIEKKGKTIAMFDEKTS